MKKLYIIIFVALMVFACKEKPPQEKTNKFSGLWSLHIMEQQDSITGKYKEWRNGMQGYILYGEKNTMSVHLTTKGYQNSNLRFPNFNDTISIEALKHLTGSYVYFAKYTIDKEKQVIEHARISHSNPDEWNNIVRRKYTFKGDTLILEPVEEQNAALRLKWIKNE